MSVQTYTRRYGQGSRRALALHCALAHSGAWTALTDVLSSQLDVTAMDLPGHGRSADWDGVRDYFDVSTEAAARYLDEVPRDLIGHSFGATLALRLAIEYPARVRSLNLFEPVFFAAAKAAAPEAFETALADAPGFDAALQAGDSNLAARLFNRYWGDGTKWDTFSEKARRYMTDRIHLIPAQNPGLFNDRAGLLAPGQLERADMPVLLMHGEKSPSVVRLINRALTARLPDVHVAEIAGAGHMAPLTHPHLVAAEIEKFLEMT